MRASLTVLVITLLTAAALSTSGCGLKSDLYLPGDKPEKPAAPAATQDENETKDEDEKKSASADG